MEALTELRAVTAGVTYGELATLRRRLWANEDDAYRWFGQYLPTTAEQRREIEAGFESTVRRAIARDGPLGAWCARLRGEIEPAMPFDSLLAGHPALDQPVITPNVAAWRVLARFGGVFEVEDGWAVVPDLASAVAKTRSALAELAGRPPAEALASLGFSMTDDELLDWLTQCGYHLSATELHTSRRTPNRMTERVSRAKPAYRGPSATDWTEKLLERTGSPLHVDEVLRRLPRKFSRGPMYNRLNADPRFVRTAPSTFALARWNIEPHSASPESSTDNAVRLIETEGRPLHLDEIRARLGKPITREGLRNALNATGRLIRVAPSTYDVIRPDTSDATEAR